MGVQLHTQIHSSDRQSRWLIFPLSIQIIIVFSEADEDFWLQLEPADEHIKFPFRPRSSASIFSHRIFKRHSVGVAYECCISKGCTIDELKSYCGR
jgi:hypothetical protein